MGEQALRRLGRPQVQGRVGPGDDRAADDLGERLEPRGAGAACRRDHAGGAAVGELRGVARRDRAARGRAQRTEALRRRGRADALVAVEPTDRRPISSARRPASVAAAARACDCAAKASWSAREMPSRAFSASESSIIPASWIEQYRPSCTITSIIGWSPIAAAPRTWTACGAPVIESKPPTTAQSPRPRGSCSPPAPRS